MNTLAGILVLLAPAYPVSGQTPPETPAFEVASIKPAARQTEGHVRVMMGGDPGRINYSNVSLKLVLARAYNVRNYQIGGPSWLESERFDIVAKVPDGTPREQVPAMLQNLLAERFKMKVHRETKEQQVYALITGKNGPKLKKADENAQPAPVSHSGGPPARRGMFVISNNGHLELKGATMGSFTDMLSNLMDRPVVDMTGIEGAYDITLDVSMEDLGGMRRMMAERGPGPGPAMGGETAPAPENGPAASIFTAVQQLGLKLDARKAPVEFVVVDSAEKVPTEN